jgi:hypothetical protein
LQLVFFSFLVILIIQLNQGCDSTYVSQLVLRVRLVNVASNNVMNDI